MRRPLGGFVTGLLFWVLFYRQTHDPGVLGVGHGAAPDAGGAPARCSSRSSARPTRRLRPALWLKRYRLALFATSVAWGLAPVMFLPQRDLVYAIVMMLVMLGMAVGGIAAIATDRLSVWLWLVPLSLPLPLVLMHHDGPQEYLALAAFSLVFVALSLRVTLAQNRVLSTALRARFENAALVERAAPAGRTDRAGQPRQEPLPRRRQPRPAPAAACARPVRRRAGEAPRRIRARSR